MTEIKSEHDLLIRIDERTNAIGKKVDSLELWANNLPCQTQTEKISTLEKITWGALLASGAAVLKSFWSIFPSGGG